MLSDVSEFNESRPGKAVNAITRVPCERVNTER